MTILHLVDKQKTFSFFDQLTEQLKNEPKLPNIVRGVLIVETDQKEIGVIAAGHFDSDVSQVGLLTYGIKVIFESS